MRVLWRCPSKTEKGVCFMKNRKTKKILSIALSAVLTLALLMAFLAPVGAAGLSEIKETLDGNGDGDVNYLALGSLITDGQGVPSGKAYPSLVREKLESTGKTVSLKELVIPGMRAEELRYLLDSDYTGDAYTYEKFLGDKGIFAELGGVDSLRTQYTNAISEAEVITLEVGIANFLNYALDYAFNFEYEADFTIFDAGLQRSANEIKGRFEDVLKGYVDSPETAEFLQRVIDGVAYAIVGYAVNFDEVLANIYKLNPDVTVTVLNITNPLSGLDATMSGLDFPIPLSMIYGIVTDVANIYVASLSEYDGSYNFAYVGEDDFKTFESHILGGGEISSELSAYLDGYAKNENAKKVLVKLIKIAAGYKSLDLTAAATTDKDARVLVEEILAAAANEGFSLETNTAYKALISDAGAMTKLAIAVRCGSGSLLVLPDASGHNAIAEKVTNAIANSTKGSDVIAEDMNEAYSLLLEYLDRDTLLDLEYTFTPHYVLNPGKSYYVALGDGSAADRNSYVTKLAETLGLTNKIPSKNRYKNWARVGDTPASVLADIGKYTSDLLQADLVTISFNNAATTKYMFDQLMEAVKPNGNPKVNNWSEILDPLDPTIAPEIEGVKEVMREELLKSLGDEKTADVLITAIESYAFSYISRLATYPMLVDQIHSITRGKALVVIVGAYNDMAGVTLNIGGEELPLGTYIQYLIDVANLESLIYSALSEKTAYVACPEIETKLGTTNIDLNNLSNILSLTNLIKADSYNPTDAGHAKITKAVIDSITIVSPHACVYDNDCDTRCDICKNKRTVKGHVFDSVCDEECNICGARNKAPALHEYDAPCDDKCNICNKNREAADHVYTGICDTLCDACKNTRVAEGEHKFGEWTESDGEKTRKCSVCGTVEQETVEKPADNTVIIIVTVVAAAAVLGGGGAACFIFLKKKPKA